MNAFRFAVVSAVFLGATSASAHDYWLLPATFAPDTGKPVGVRVFVGDHFASEVERPYQKKPTLRFQLVSKAGAVDLMKSAKEGAKPYGTVRLKKPGSYWITLDRDFSHIVLKPEKFAKYLKHENLQAILKARKEAGESGKPGRERYCRFLKCLIHAGGERDDTWKAILKQRLEIVPLSDPSGVQTRRDVEGSHPVRGQAAPQGSRVRAQQRSRQEHRAHAIGHDR